MPDMPGSRYTQSDSQGAARGDAVYATITVETCKIVTVIGYAAGSRYENGSGSNFLCLHEVPQWRSYINGRQTYTGSIYGVEYELYTGNNIFSEDNAGGQLFNKPAPCAVCYVAGRSTVLMVPARTQCPDGWAPEYAGYLGSEMAGPARHRNNYICWDEAPEVAVGGTAQDQAVIYPCLLYTSPSPRDGLLSRMPSSA